MDGMCSAVDVQYQHQYEQTRQLEDEVKDNQRLINQLRADIQNKKKTLRTYEGILKQPNIKNGDGDVVKKCQVCFKLFASEEYLTTHYKRRHLEFYTSEIRPKEDELLKRELGELAEEMANQNQGMDQEEMVQQIKDEVVDRFNTNLLSLQQEVSTIRQAEKEQISSLVEKT